jgi:hypothetical protein
MQRANVPVGFGAASVASPFSATEFFHNGVITPDAVHRVLQRMSAFSTPILIIDEFDRLGSEPRRAFADLIKSLSDDAVDATVLLVGVADSVGELIAEHQSVARALVQIPMPRMAPEEIRPIVEQGAARLGMRISDSAVRRILLLAQGLPHYAHLVALHSARAALDARSLDIALENVNQAIGKAIDGAQHSIRTAYHSAIRSARKDNLFADVLLSCALAPADELGFFAAQDVRAPMRRITGKNYDIPAFAQHLTEFADSKRGRILQRTGTERRYRYRFSDPLMQPYVIMQGISHQKIGDDDFV